MSELDTTPQSPLQFELENSSQQDTPLPSQELCTSLLTDEDSVEGKVISLASKAKKDAELTAGWDDHSSDEDEFDPEAENKEPEEDEEEESDSEADTSFHGSCVCMSEEVFEYLHGKGWKAEGKKKEAKAALAGVLEDHFTSN
jgi:hypothetical protein